jgi:hypothetical protein
MKFKFTRGFELLVGLSLWAIAGFIIFLIKCPPKLGVLFVYILLGTGLVFIIERIHNASLKLNLGYIAVHFVGPAAITFCLAFWDPIGAYKHSTCDERINVTVFVHGQKGKNDLVLRDKGNVWMDVSGERKTEPINSKGVAVFSNINISDSFRLGIDFSEPYYPVNQDSTYLVTDHNGIDLCVVLMGNSKVWGTVMFANTPLESVTVTINQLTTQTDSLGRFELLIPESVRGNEYKVWFYKKGFKMVSYSAHPQTGQSLDVNMEKD